MIIGSLSFTISSEWDRHCQHGLLYINNNLDVNNISIKTFTSLMIENSRIAAGYIAGTFHTSNV